MGAHSGISLGGLTRGIIDDPLDHGGLKFFELITTTTLDIASLTVILSFIIIRCFMAGTWILLICASLLVVGRWRTVRLAISRVVVVKS